VKWQTGVFEEEKGKVHRCKLGKENSIAELRFVVWKSEEIDVADPQSQN